HTRFSRDWSSDVCSSDLEIDAYIKKLQYEKESFEIEVFPNTEELIVTKGEVIAYSGNTGGSGGPHLHFEIRDNQERPINPLLFRSEERRVGKECIDRR